MTGVSICRRTINLLYAGVILSGKNSTNSAMIISSGICPCFSTLKMLLFVNERLVLCHYFELKLSVQSLLQFEYLRINGIQLKLKAVWKMNIRESKKKRNIGECLHTQELTWYLRLFCLWIFLSFDNNIIRVMDSISSYPGLVYRFNEKLVPGKTCSYFDNLTRLQL